MSVLITVIKYVSLFFAIWFTQVNILRACYKINVPVINIVIQSMALTVFLVLQFGL